MKMFLLSNTIDDESINEVPKSMKRSTFLIRKLLFLALCLIFLTILIVFQSVVRNPPSELYPLIIISLLAMIIISIVRFIQLRNGLKKCYLENPAKNLVSYIMKFSSIGLTLFLSIFVGSIMSPIDLGYGSFATFVLFLICILTAIGICTLLIYLLIIFIGYIWRRCSFLRQQLSSGLVAFFLASCLICSLFMCFIAFPTGSPGTGFALGICLALSTVLFTGGATALVLYQSKRAKRLSGLPLSVGCIGMILILWFYLNDGYDMRIQVITPSERYPNKVTDDPSIHGNYSYSFLTYGSGVDDRIEYGKKASIITPTIDLSALIKLSNFNQKAFKFNESNLPLNGRIWYPNSNATSLYPLVVMVHGNHLSTEPSEIGYDYLGEMLASQGFIAVSIDENFLNLAAIFSVTRFGRISTLKQYILSSNTGPEYIARALILLETLKEFRRWNSDPTHQFYQKFDLSNIGLMGHSRGGEAIIIAYLLNQLNYLPEYPSDVHFTNYNFGIKALFSIGATIDGYQPLGRSLHYSNVNLFALQGIYDGDTNDFFSQSTIHHLQFTTNSDYYFKASLFVHQANHGQFNNDWGRFDLNFGTDKWMNIRPVMTMEEQQHLGRIYMSAMMNLVLKNQREYRSIFEDYRSIRHYLPNTNYISTFADSNEIILADFENIDVTHGTINGSTMNTTDLLLWSSVYIKTYHSAMLLLQAKDNSIGIYTFHLENPVNGTNLRFLVGRTSEGLVDDLLVRVFYQNGTSDSFNVHVLPALTKRMYKISEEEYVFAVQTISLPLIDAIVSLEFHINGTNAQFLLDDLVLVK